MTSDYYSRTHTVNSDGVRGFATKQDVWNQQKAATEFAKVLGAEMKEFGQLCAIDYYALVKGKMAGVVEVKCRSHESSRFPTVFLNVRKWLALQMASVGLGVPAYFVVQFADGVRYINIAEVDAARHRVAGTKYLVKSHTDIEPVIEVPVSQMEKVN
jgi:hypothetical protein